MLNLPQFVFINGPAGSGKSTLAHLMSESAPGCWRDAFAEPIREMVRTVFFPEEGPISYEHDLKDGEVKRRNMLQLAKLTLNFEGEDPLVRQTMIDFSEKFMKPRFGLDIFGQLLWKRCQEQSLFYKTFIIDDLGFIPEASYVADQVGKSSCIILRLHRAGCDFSGDSRSYIEIPGIRVINLYNDGAPMEMIDNLELELGNL